MKKRLRALTGIVLALALATGCGSSGAQKSGQAPASSPQQTKQPSLDDPASISGEITVWGWAPWDVAFNALLPEFNKKYPNIKVKIEMMGYEDTHNKLLAALAAGSGAPDVVGIEINFIDKFALQGGLTNLLAPPFNAGKYKNDFVEYKWTQATAPDGRLIALPWDIGPGAIFYRRDIFEKAGLPSDPEKVAQLLKTWDDYIAVGRQIKEKTGAFMVANPMDIFKIPFNHKDMFDKDWNVVVDGPLGQKYLNIAKKIRAAGIDARIETWSAEWQAAIPAGKLATIYGGSWMGGNLKTWLDKDGAGKWGVIPVPEDPGQNWGGSFLAIPEQSKNKLAAWAFVEFALATTYGQNTIMKTTDIFPAYKPAFKDPLYDEPDPYFAGQKTRRLFIEIAEKIPAIITTPMDSIAETTLNQEVQVCIEQNIDTQKCLQDAKKQIETAIANDKKIALQMKNAVKR